MTARRWEFNDRHQGFHKPIDFVHLKAAVISHLMEVGPRTTEQLGKEMKGVPGVSRVNQAIRYLRDEGTIVRENYRAPWTINRQTTDKKPA